MEENKTVAENTRETAADQTSAEENAAEESVSEESVSEETVSEEVVSEDSDADETVSEEDTHRKAKKKRLIPVIAVCSVLLVFLLAFLVLVLIGTAPHSFEVGETLTHRCETVPVISKLYDVRTDISKIDALSVGEHEIDLALFGVIPLKSEFKLSDSVMPLVEARDIVIPKGFDVPPEAFIAVKLDITPLSCAYVSAPDFGADGTVKINVSDGAGNTVSVTADYTVSDILSVHTFEYGITPSFLENRLMTLFGLENVDVSHIETEKCGSYPVTGERDGQVFVFGVNITDSTPPTALVRSFDLLIGQRVDINDIVSEIEDVTEVTVSYDPEPVFDKAGKQTVNVTLTDENGNSAEFTSKINIHALADSMTIEAGTSHSGLANTISMMLGTDDEYPRLSEYFDPARLGVGTHKAVLVGEYSEISMNITVEDTSPPIFSLRRMTVYKGTMPSAEDFVIECSDASEVTFSVDNVPDVSVSGNYIVTVIGTDSHGNSASVSTSLKVAEDNVPPTIYGIKNITAYEGDTISYRSGVYAVDERDGRLSVKADSSNVKPSRAGTYNVTYSVTDSDGNTAVATATVTVKPISMAAVYEKADAILASIVKDSMSAREKARAIYDWCTGNLKYSTATSHLMGYFDKAAYSGFTKRYGNCYTYYAVAGAMLTRAGITNTVIQRDDPTNPHYWNLVNIDGSWYHFDTCPQPYPHKLEVFLLTDAEVKAFSLDYYYSFAAGVYPATP